MQATLEIVGGGKRLSGWRYFWAKRVNGFNPDRCCAQCFKGPYVDGLGAVMATNTPVVLSRKPGEIVYICGVSSPYRYNRNFHLAVRVTECVVCDRIERPMYSGHTVIVHGAELIEFDDKVAAELPDTTAAQRACRNYQFGAQMFPEVDALECDAERYCDD